MTQNNLGNAPLALIKQRSDNVKTAEATKHALVMPCINHVLGYNVFDPAEVIPEFIADVGTKKGEKVDYAIFRDGDPTGLLASEGNDGRHTVGQAPHVAALASLDKNKDPGAAIETLSTCQPGSAHAAGTAMNALEYHSPAAVAAQFRMSSPDYSGGFGFW